MTTPAEHEERYRALRAVVGIIRMLAFIVAIVGGLAILIGAITTMVSVAETSVRGSWC